MTALSAPSARPTARFPWISVLVLMVGTLATVTAELLPAGLLLSIGAGLGVAPGTVGYLVTAWGVTVAVASLPLTRLTRRLDRRTVLAGSLLVSGAATVLTAVAPAYWVLVVLRVVAAAAHGLFWSQVVVAGSTIAPQRHVSRAVAVVVAGPTVASIVLIPALTALGEAASWRWAFGLSGVLTLLAALLLAIVLPGLAPAASERRVRRDPSVVPVVLTASLSAVLLVAHFASYTYVAPLLSGPGALPRELLSVALVVLGAAGALGLVLAPVLVRRLPYAALPLTGLALAVALVAVRAAHGPIPVLAAVAGWGLVIGALPVVFQIRLIMLATERFRATAGAVMVVALNLGVGSGAALGAGLYRLFGVGPLPLLAAVVAAAAAFALWLYRSPSLYL